jgi:hypothetical protein
MGEVFVRWIERESTTIAYGPIRHYFPNSYIVWTHEPDMRPSMVVDRETLERLATFSLVAVEDDFPVGYRESLVPHDQPSLLIQQVLNRGRPVLLGDCLHKLVLRLVSRQRREALRVGFTLNSKSTLPSWSALRKAGWSP